MKSETVKSKFARALSLSAALLAMGAGSSALAQLSAVDMNVLGPGPTVLGPSMGASTLSRDILGATGTVHVADLGTNTSVLDPSGVVVYSVWAIVFNRPENCLRLNGICSPGEEGPRPGNPSKLSIYWAAGGIASPKIEGVAATLNLRFRLKRGRPEGFVNPAFWPHGLTNPLGAEIHLVIAPHPEAMKGNVAFPLTHPGPTIRGAVHLPPMDD